MNAPLAQGYPQKRLADVAEFLDGLRRDLPAASRRPGPYPYFGAHGQQGTTDAHCFDEPLVLLAEDLSGYAGSGKPLALAIRGKSWVSRRIHVLRPGAQIDADFLARVLEHVDLDRYAGGARRDRLTRANAAEIRVPLPTLEEQRAIAAALAQADRIRERRMRAGGQLDAFVRVYFLEHFGDPQSNPRRWPRLAFGALAENQNALRTPRDATGPDANGEGYPRYGAEGIVDRAREARFDGERLLVAADGINLVTRLEPISRVVGGQFAVSEHAHVVAANARADLHYLHHALELSELKPYLTNAVRPRLTRAALARIPVPVPPLELQRAFCALVEKTLALKALQDVSRERLDELYASLRMSALRGERLIADR